MILGDGGSAPVLSGSVVVDLNRMNRSSKSTMSAATRSSSRACRISIFIEHPRSRAQPSIDTPDPGWGSVIGTRSITAWATCMVLNRDHLYSHSGTEVVVPTGEIIRTGMGALPVAKTWGDYDYGFGPYGDGCVLAKERGHRHAHGHLLMPVRSVSVVLCARAGCDDIILLVAEADPPRARGPDRHAELRPTVVVVVRRRFAGADRAPRGLNPAEIERFVIYVGMRYWEVNLHATDLRHQLVQLGLRKATSQPPFAAELPRRSSGCGPADGRARAHARHRVAIGVPDLDILFVRAARSSLRRRATVTSGSRRRF